MQITSQDIKDKKFSEYQVTEADVMFFSNLIGDMGSDYKASGFRPFKTWHRICKTTIRTKYRR